MQAEDYGVWIISRQQDKETSYPITEADEQLGYPLKQFGNSLYLFKNGELLTTITQTSLNEWIFIRMSSRVWVQLEQRNDPLTLKQALDNIKPWVFK